MGKRRSRQSPMKSCVNKKRFASRDDAQKSLDNKRWMENEEDYDPGPALKIYSCTFCGGYHFARKKGWK